MTIFLDLDGPLLDVSERYFRVHTDILSRVGIKPTDKAAFWNCKRAGKSQTSMLNEMGATAHSAAYNKLWLESIESDYYLALDRVHSGVVRLLGELAQEYPLVLVTLRQRAEAVHCQLKRLNLHSFFRDVLTAPPLSRDSWQVKQRLIESSGMADRTSWIVGDTEVDITAGKSLGLTTVAVLSGVRNEEQLKQLAPDFILPNILKLPKVLSEEKNLVCSGKSSTRTQNH